MAAKKTSKRQPAARSRGAVDPEKELAQFIAKFEPRNQTLIRAMRRALRKRLPAANELVYDNYNFFVIGYSPTERPSHTIVSIAAGAAGVGLAFYYGAKLSDPHKLLLGSGSQNRFIRLASMDVLADPRVQELISKAVTLAKVPLPERGRGRLIIRSVSEKQRPRRKA